MEEENNQEQINAYVKGRGAQFNTQNKFIKNQRQEQYLDNYISRFRISCKAR